MSVKFDPILGELRESDASGSDNLTANEVAGIQGANALSGTNPVATQDDLPQPGTDYQSPIVTNNPQAGTTYTLALTDEYVTCTNGAAIALTVPTNANVAFPVGKVITIEQGGAGQITVSGDGGVDIHAYDSGVKTAGQYACVQLVKKATNTWTLIGGIA